MIVQTIEKALQQSVTSLHLPAQDIHLEHPADEKFGDYSSNIAMAIFSQLKSDTEKRKTTGKSIKLEGIKSPRELAQLIVKDLQKNPDLHNIISKIDVAGAGFINFWMSNEWLLASINRFTDTPFTFPHHNLGTHKRLIIEFAHFNTHKAVHIGHLRNITLGESLSRIYEALGNNVVRLSYGGDVGLHIAKCLYGFRMLNELPKTIAEKTDLLARAYSAGHNAYEDVPEAKNEIVDINRKIYDKHSDVYVLWKETRQWSLDHFDHIYDRLDTRFDGLYYESEVYERGLALCREALEKGILKESEGAVIFNGEPFGMDTRVFITQEGNPTYEGKELGIAEKEFTEHGDVDKVIHVVAPEQASFFSVTFKVEELLRPELFRHKQYHFAYGYVRLTSGKMSSRKGTIIQAEWLLDEVKKRILESYPDMLEEPAELLAVASTKYSFLKIDARQDISFDINQSISLEGNSGPYLLYTYVRARSVLSKVNSQQSKVNMTRQNSTITMEELSLVRTLYKFPEAVVDAGKTFSPNIIANYLYDLAQKFNLFYQKVPILSSSDEEKEFRLVLTQSVSQVLKNGLNLLGINVLEKM